MKSLQDDIDSIQLQLKATQGFQLEITNAAIQYLAEVGYDPEFGARPVKRAIQRYVLNDLPKKILADEVSNAKPIIIDSFGNGLVFRN